MTNQKATPAETSKIVVLLVAMMSAFLTPFTASSINIALPMIGAELSLDAVALNWVATAYLLAASCSILPFGRLADIWGRKKVFQIGILIDAIASILCAVAPSGEWLIALRAVQGIGGAMIFGTSTAILTSVYPEHTRGRALGLTAASVYTGLSIGPLVGGWVTQHFGWQGAFLINATIGLTITAVAFLWLKGEWAEAKGEAFDYTGSFLYSAGLLALIYALSILPSSWGFGLIIAGLAALGVFVRREGSQSFPLLNTEFFRSNSGFAYSNLAALINYSATFAVGFLLSLYLQYIGGFTAEHAGLILMTQPVIMVICSPIAGILSDRIEPRVVASVGMALTTAGLGMLAFLGGSLDIIWVFASLFVLGAGFGFFSAPNTNAVMSSVSRKFYGVAAGTLGTMRLTGQAFSLALVLLLFSLDIGKVQIIPANYSLFLQSMRLAFILSASLCFAGIFASVARGRVHEA